MDLKEINDVVERLEAGSIMSLKLYDEPVVAQPVNDEVVADLPANELPVNDLRVNEKPIDEKPVNDQPVSVNNADDGSHKKQNSTDSASSGSTIVSAESTASTASQNSSSSETGAELSDADYYAALHGAEIFSFFVSKECREIQIHKGVLEQGTMSFLLKFPSDDSKTNFILNHIEIPIFKQVRIYMYRGPEETLQIQHEIHTDGSYKLRPGIHVLIKQYILAHKLGMEWLEDLLVDFIMTGYRKLGQLPTLQETKYVYFNTEDTARLRNYLAIALQHRVVLSMSETSTKELCEVMQKYPALHEDFLGTIRGICMSSEKGFVRLNHHLVCAFHVHSDGSDCYARDLEIYELEWFPDEDSSTELSTSEDSQVLDESVVPVDTASATAVETPGADAADAADAVVGAADGPDTADQSVSEGSTIEIEVTAGRARSSTTTGGSEIAARRASLGPTLSRASTVRSGGSSGRAISRVSTLSDLGETPRGFDYLQ